MKMKSIRNALFLGVLAIAPYTLAPAQSSAPACDGNVATVRVSAIKPGAIDAFLAAVAAHKAWYQSHGSTKDVIVASRILVRDEKSGATKYSDAEVMTYHLYPAGPRQP